MEDSAAGAPPFATVLGAKPNLRALASCNDGCVVLITQTVADCGGDIEVASFLVALLDGSIPNATLAPGRRGRETHDLGHVVAYDVTAAVLARREIVEIAHDVGPPRGTDEVAIDADLKSAERHGIPSSSS
jgi:hypothetical protein